jgi:hypothetical protein
MQKQKVKIRSVMGKFHGPASALLTFFSLGFGWLVFSLVSGSE